MLHRSFEIETAHVEHVSHWSGCVGRAQDLGQGIHASNTAFELVEFGWRDQIGLVQHEHVREGDLLAALVGNFQVQENMFCIDQGDDAVEREELAHVLIHEERLRHGSRVREPRRLDQDLVESSRRPLRPH